MLRGCDKWLPGYLHSICRRPRRVDGTRHLLFCVADHFEPFRGGVPKSEALDTVRDWVARYTESVSGVRGADGRGPRHTFFYPGDEYDADVVDCLADACRTGAGEVEVHLHHRDDTAETLQDKLTRFRDRLSEGHGLLGRDSAGRPWYGFVHGNWALCNSHPSGEWCGVNGELKVLSETRCYADFTFPSAPSPTQPRLVNAIYRARDVVERPRGHDRGRRVRAGDSERDTDGLVLVQGPLALNWGRRKWGVLPRLENADITGVNPPTPDRIDLWASQRIHVLGRPEWVFVKVHTHGCLPANRSVVLGNYFRRMHAHLDERYNDGVAWRLHYVTARELYNVVRAAED